MNKLPESQETQNPHLVEEKDPGWQVKLGSEVLLPTSDQKAHDSALNKLRIRMGTLLKIDNVSFLLGAGCSIAAGGPTLKRIPLSVEKHILTKGTTDGKHESWLGLFYKIVGMMGKREYDMTSRMGVMAKHVIAEDKSNSQITSQASKDEIPINLEDFLCYLHEAFLAIENKKACLYLCDLGKTEILASDLEVLIDSLTEGLALTCNLPIEGKQNFVESHAKLIKKILTRPLNLRRVNLFTLNYDTLIEQACDAEGVVVLDGFVGTMRRVFRPESYDQDLYFPAQTTEGRVHRLDRVLHLYKLHGSINWHHTAHSDWSNPYGLYASYDNESCTDNNILIFPTPLKSFQTLGMPYSELLRRFAVAVVQPQSVLFVIGYGFGDAHVNAIITQAMAVPSFNLIIIGLDPICQYVDLLDKRNDERVCIIKGQELGTFEGFVTNILPDLQDEKIMSEVIETYKRLRELSIPDEKAGEDCAK
jgi:hypothetical protein